MTKAAIIMIIAELPRNCKRPNLDDGTTRSYISSLKLPMMCSLLIGSTNPVFFPKIHPDIIIVKEYMIQIQRLDTKLMIAGSPIRKQTHAPT